MKNLLVFAIALDVMLAVWVVYLLIELSHHT